MRNTNANTDGGTIDVSRDQAATHLFDHLVDSVAWRECLILGIDRTEAARQWNAHVAIKAMPPRAVCGIESKGIG